MVYCNWLISLLALQIIAIIVFAIIGIVNRSWERCQKGRLGVTAVLNFVLQVLPKLYNNAASGEGSTNHFFILFDSIGDAVKMFVAEVNVNDFAEFARQYKLFYCVFSLGFLMAIANTIVVAFILYRRIFKNRNLLKKRLRAPVCDVVVGTNAPALKYVQNNKNSVLLADDKVGKGTIANLMDSNIAVLHHNISNGFFTHSFFKKKSRYNIICIGNEYNVINYINSFIAYKNAHPKSTNFYLYVEIESDISESIRREIIDKSEYKSYIFTFCSNELLARTITEQHPFTKYLPREYIEKAAIKPDTKLNVYILGFGNLNRELYRQFIYRNQFVSFKKGEYNILPVNYYICDDSIDEDDEIISGFSKSIEELKKSDYIALPEPPFKAETIQSSPTCHSIISRIKDSIKAENSYTFIVVNTDDDCRNIELGVKLKNRFSDNNNFHIFIKTEATYAKDTETITYFGKGDDVLQHEVIVNDSLSKTAIKLHELYILKKMQSEPWDKLPYFKVISNIQAALNLRVVLNLLGLDYIADGKRENLDLIEKRLQRVPNTCLKDYFKQTNINAIIAQEHTRWTAFHILNEYLPLKTSAIVKTKKDNEVSFITQKPEIKKHACITTHKGIGLLAEHLAKLAENGATPEQFETYQYDVILVETIKTLFEEFGHSIIDISQK